MNWLEILGIIFLVFLIGGVIGYAIVWATQLLETQRDILSTLKEDKEDPREDDPSEADEEGGV